MFLLLLEFFFHQKMLVYLLILVFGGIYVGYGFQRNLCNPNCSMFTTETYPGYEYSESQQILDSINNWRKAFVSGNYTLNDYMYGTFPNASNMNSLLWDNEMARIASEYANTCPSIDDMAQQKGNLSTTIEQSIKDDSTKFKYVSSDVENISSYYIGIKVKNETDTTIYSLIGKGWLAHLFGYRFLPGNGTIECPGLQGNEFKCNSIKTLLSANIRYIGCGYSICDTNGTAHVIMICNVYPYPIGLKFGETPYQVGIPCSDCDIDRTCLENVCGGGVCSTFIEAPCNTTNDCLDGTTSNGRSLDGCSTLSPTQSTIEPSLPPTNYPTHIPTISPTLTPSILPSISPTGNCPNIAEPESAVQCFNIGCCFCVDAIDSSLTSCSFNIEAICDDSNGNLFCRPPGSTITPTKSPTKSPTSTPTIIPTSTPSISPTISPTISPSITPTKNPTKTPTITPSSTPSVPSTISPSRATLDPSISPIQTIVISTNNIMSANSLSISRLLPWILTGIIGALCVITFMAIICYFMYNKKNRSIQDVKDIKTINSLKPQIEPVSPTTDDLELTQESHSIELMYDKDLKISPKTAGKIHYDAELQNIIKKKNQDTIEPKSWKCGEVSPAMTNKTVASKDGDMHIISEDKSFNVPDTQYF